MAEILQNNIGFGKYLGIKFTYLSEFEYVPVTKK